MSFTVLKNFTLKSENSEWLLWEWPYLTVARKGNYEPSWMVIKINRRPSDFVAKLLGSYAQSFRADCVWCLSTIDTKPSCGFEVAGTGDCSTRNHSQETGQCLSYLGVTIRTPRSISKTRYPIDVLIESFWSELTRRKRFTTSVICSTRKKFLVTTKPSWPSLIFKTDSHNVIHFLDRIIFRFVWIFRHSIVHLDVLQVVLISFGRCNIKLRTHSVHQKLAYDWDIAMNQRSIWC